MKKIIIILLVSFITFTFGCDDDTSDSNETTDQYESNWLFNSPYWEQDGNSLTYLGAPSDQAAWIDKDLPENVEITMKWKADTDGSERYEFTVFLFGNKMLDGNFWPDGLTVNYLVEPSRTVSWVRNNGIQSGEGANYLKEITGLPVLSTGEYHEMKIIYKNHRVSFYVDGNIVYEDELNEIGNYNGSFGISNFNGNHHNFTIKDVTIVEL